MQTISVYALLQGVCAHPGACGNPGLRADSIRPYPVRFKIWERLQNRTRSVGVANLATRCGEAKGRLRELIPFNVPICSGNGGEPRRLRRSGRQVGDPYKADAFIRVLPEIRVYGRIISAPTERVLFILLYVVKSNLSY